MHKIKGFSPRGYQEEISKSCLDKNTLVCLPTGTGKTKLAIMVMIDRLNQFPDSKAIIISPTKPLSSQIANEVRTQTNIPTSKIHLLTGAISPQERTKLFNASTVIVATPQTIQFDAEKKRISLENTSLLVVDECHRSKEKFANTIVAKYYKSQCKNSRILALTASPGATKDKVSEVCSNLSIENIELRTEMDTDMARHIQEKQTENIRLYLPKEFKEIQVLLKSRYKDGVGKLKRYGIKKPPSVINKTDLLLYQKSFQKQIKSGNPLGYSAISTIAGLIKINYALELLETQTPKALYNYFNKLKTEKSKASKNILNDKSIDKAIDLTKQLVNKNKMHPKLDKLISILQEELSNNMSNKTILFANYRSTVSELKEEISKINGAKPTILVGQKGGVTQKDQIATIKKFNQGVYNVLICTSIGEEGLSIGSLDLAIFYDHTASEIRKIQRAGRVARIKPGKIINLITKNTLDEALFWTSKRKEVKMHNLLNYMQKNLQKD
tara:strand:- start:4959 stop:6452 length:1494 start_codon:yes stop_codon:yes gene_type:complete